MFANASFTKKGRISALLHSLISQSVTPDTTFYRIAGSGDLSYQDITAMLTAADESPMSDAATNGVANGLAVAVADALAMAEPMADAVADAAADAAADGAADQRAVATHANHDPALDVTADQMAHLDSSPSSTGSLVVLTSVPAELTGAHENEQSSHLITSSEDDPSQQSLHHQAVQAVPQITSSEADIQQQSALHHLVHKQRG